MRSITLVLLCCQMIVIASCAAAGTQLEVEGVAIPYYAAGETNPAVVVRIKRLFNGYQRKGFFRIGALPAIIAEGVTIEVYQRHHAQQALEELHRRLDRTTRETVLECRQIVVNYPPETTPRLQARSGRLLRRSCWEFNHVTARTNARELHLARARFNFAGDSGGKLVGTDGRILQEFNLFCNEQLKRFQGND